MIDLIKLLTNKKLYYRFKPFITEQALPKETRLIIRDFDEYYTTNPDIDEIDIDQFSTWFLILKHSTFKPDVLEIYQEIFKNVKLSTTKTRTEEDIIEEFIQRDYATRLSDIALRVAEGDDKTDIDGCQAILDEYRDESARATTKEEGFIEDDVHALITSAGTGLDWRLRSLNLSLGPLRKGNLIVVGKLPETGGTAFAVSEASHMLSQLEDDQTILYLCNEEPGRAIKTRFISSVINRNFKYIEAHPVPCWDEFKLAGGERIKIKEAHGKNMRQLEEVVKECNPGLIVFDQLWKVPSHNKDNDVQRITNLFVKARQMAAEYAPVIAIHQADGSAFNSAYLGMEQLYMSRIGIQGEADAIIMIGLSDEVGKEDTRYINVPKNKLQGGGISEARYRHSKWEVQILTETSRFKD